MSASTIDFRKRLMGLALVLSLALHIGAAVVVIIASGIRTGGKSSADFILQDISLAPSISAPAIKKAVSPSVDRTTIPPVSTSLTAADTDKPAQDSTSEPLPQSSVSSGNVEGLMTTPLGLGMTHGYFSGLADGRSLRDEIRGYYFEVVEKINREWWDKAGLLKEPIRQDGVFELLLQRDGTIASIRILQGTGSNEADRLLSEIIRNTSPLPSLPATYDLSMFRAPLRIKAPSFLFRLKN